MLLKNTFLQKKKTSKVIGILLTFFIKKCILLKTFLKSYLPQQNKNEYNITKTIKNYLPK